MKGPIRDWLNLRPFLGSLLHGREHRLVERSLALAEPRKWRLGTRRKQVIAAVDCRLRRNDAKRRLR